MSYLKTAFNYITAHWATTAALLVVIWNYASPTVADYVHNHPHVTFWFGLATVIVTFYWRSPAFPNAPSVPKV